MHSLKALRHGSHSFTGKLHHALHAFSRRCLVTMSLLPRSRGCGCQRRLSVCLSVFPQNMSKTAAARITNLTQKYSTMSPAWKPFYFGGQKVKGQGQDTKTVPTSVDFCTLVNAGLFQLRFGTLHGRWWVNCCILVPGVPPLHTRPFTRAFMCIGSTRDRMQVVYA